MSTSAADAEARRYHHGSLREALLQRATEVIAEDGVEAVTLRGLARDLGVSHAAPGRHFATRNDLLAAVAEEGVDRLIATAEEEELRTGDAGGPERLASTARAYLRWAMSHPAHYSAVRNPEVMRFAKPSLRHKLAEFGARQRRATAEAQAAGWEADLPLDAAVFRFAVLLVGSATLLTDRLYQEIFPSGDEPVVEGVVNFLLHGVTRKGTEPSV